jgi:hypothetical protein
MAPSALGTNGQTQLYMSYCDVGFSGNAGGLDVVPTNATPAYVHIINSEVHNLKYGTKFDSSQLSSSTDAVDAEVETSEYFAFSGGGLGLVGTGTGYAHVAFSRSAVLDAGGPAVNVNGANAAVILYEDVILGNNSGVNLESSGGAAASAGNNMIYGNGSGNSANCVQNGTPNQSCSGILSANGTQ